MQRKHESDWHIRQRLATWALLAMAASCRRVTISPALYTEARAVVDRHCVACHSEHPTVRAFPIAPGGVALDTSREMHKYAERIKARAVSDRTMPLLNKSGMTDGERDVLARWVEHGSKIP